MTVDLKKSPYPYESKKVNAIADQYQIEKWSCVCSVNKD